ncbi:alpha/beta hydrolase [Octadecabacter sp.]|nr:alpha/beta hydrolase [Octadecabacter sp.]
MLRTVAGQNVWVTQTGHGPLRIFVHCSFGQSRTLMPLADLLPPGRNVFFDLPGHGKSAPWVGDNYHSDVLGIVDELADEPAHVIGHSFGATVALRLAIEQPHRVARLTLIEPVMFAAAKDARALSVHRAAFSPFVSAMENGDLEKASELFVSMWGTGPSWPNLSKRRRDRIISQIHLIPAAASVIEDDEPKLADRLENVSCIVDLIEGSTSQPIMSAILDGLEATIPHVNRTCVQGADHMVPITHAKDVARAIANSKRP